MYWDCAFTCMFMILHPLFIITKDRVFYPCWTTKGEVSCKDKDTYKDKDTSPQTAVLKDWWKYMLINIEQQYCNKTSADLWLINERN